MGEEARRDHGHGTCSHLSGPRPPARVAGGERQLYRPLGGGSAGQPKGQRAKRHRAETEALLAEMRQGSEGRVEGLLSPKAGRAER